RFCKLPEFLSNAFAVEDDLVECFSDRRIDPAWTDRQPGREVALSEGLQSREKLAMVETGTVSAPLSDIRDSRDRRHRFVPVGVLRRTSWVRWLSSEARKKGAPRVPGSSPEPRT